MCTSSTGRAWQTRGVCPQSLFNENSTYHFTFIAERGELSRWRAKFDGKNADDFLKWPSKLRASLSLYSKPIFEIVQDSQRPSDLDNNQATAREGRDDANQNLFSILFFTTSGPAFSVVRRFEGRTREDGVGHGQGAWAALREKFDG